MFGFDLRSSAAVSLCGVVFASSFAGCVRAPEQPDPPDVSRLLSTYAAPNGAVDTAAIAPWLEDAEAQFDLLGGGDAEVLLTAIFTRVAKLVDRASLPTGSDGPIRTRIDGTARTVVSCGSAADATADVEVTIVDGAVAPVVWGTAHACPLWQQGLGTRASYDGAFVMYRYPGQDYLVRVDGTVTGTGMRIRLDFRVFDGQLETRVVTPRGEVIATRDGDDVFARAANGTFRCSVTELTCVRVR
jgi:hypothetical protein